MNRRGLLYALLAIWVLCSASGGEHGVTPKVIGVLALVLVVARLMAYAFELLKQPAVLGELLAGVLVGNLDMLGFHGFEFIASDGSFALLAELGVILLLFEVGLESDLVEMARSGVTAALVAVVGVVVPIGLGFAAHAAVVDSTWEVHLFVGAILAATSVGITARVLQSLGKIDTSTARVILGAAVIDDALGLIVLAVATSIYQASKTGVALDVAGLLQIAGIAFLFLFLAIFLGRPASRMLFRVATALRTRGVLLATALAFCFGLSYAAKLSGLEFIIGAFAAGLVLESVFYRELESREPHGLEDLIRQLSSFLVPVFFVVTGARVDLNALGGDALVLATLLTVAAIVGKQACSLVAYGEGVNKLAVGLGMIPRGEVGLIFAGVGLSAGILTDSTYAAAILMVLVTTMVTPPVLVWALRRETG